MGGEMFCQFVNCFQVIDLPTQFPIISPALPRLHIQNIRVETLENIYFLTMKNMHVRRPLIWSFTQVMGQTSWDTAQFPAMPSQPVLERQNNASCSEKTNTFCSSLASSRQLPGKVSWQYSQRQGLGRRLGWEAVAISLFHCHAVARHTSWRAESE